MPIRGVPIAVDRPVEFGSLWAWISLVKADEPAHRRREANRRRNTAAEVN
jgi:hypothetical protein